MRILMVEDNPGDVRLAQIAFERSAMKSELSIVEDGAAALQYLRRQGAYASAQRPHLILLDLNVPRKNGFEVLREIKQDPDLKRIPVCVLTSSAEEGDIERSYDLHANCFVTKPEDFTRLREVVLEIGEFWFNIVRLPRSTD